MRSLLVLLCAVASALLLVPAAADAAKCVPVGEDVKRCESVRKQVCVSGDPTVCQRARSVCRIRRSGWFRCAYVAKYARCRGLNGARCQTTWTRCDSVPGRKTCRRNQLESCRSRKGAKKCHRKLDECTTRSKGRYRCENLHVQRDCVEDQPCTVFRKTCVSQDGRSRASCKAVKYTESGGGTPPAAAEQPPTEETPVEEVPPPPST